MEDTSIREAVARLLRELPPDTVAWRTTSGSYTASALAAEVESGTGVGRQYAADILRTCRDLLGRQARRADRSRCSTCRRSLDVPGDESSRDCGGDCVRCMAEAGDPDCVRAMAEISRVADDSRCPICDRRECPRFRKISGNSMPEAIASCRQAARDGFWRCAYEDCRAEQPSRAGDEAEGPAHMGWCGDNLGKSGPYDGRLDAVVRGHKWERVRP